MKATIRFQSRYTYAEAVSFSVHTYRLFPRGGRHAILHRAELQTNDDAKVTYRRDYFDNTVASAFYPEKNTELKLRLELEVELLEQNPFAFLLDSYALDLPFTYKPEELRMLEVFRQLEPVAVPELPFWQWKAGPQPTVGTLVELNAAFREHLGYERREEGAARTPAETVERMSGACRDFSVLMAAVLRQRGLAARLVSGYLLEGSEEEEERRAFGAMHAWVETYLPGAGWVGLDPTNGTLCNHLHIAAATGLTPADISPTEGRYFHPHGVPAEMTSSLEIEEHA